MRPKYPIEHDVYTPPESDVHGQVQIPERLPPGLISRITIAILFVVISFYALYVEGKVVGSIGVLKIDNLAMHVMTHLANLTMAIYAAFFAWAVIRNNCSLVRAGVILLLVHVIYMIVASMEPFLVEYNCDTKCFKHYITLSGPEVGYCDGKFAPRFTYLSFVVSVIVTLCWFRNGWLRATLILSSLAALGYLEYRIVNAYHALNCGAVFQF